MEAIAALLLQLLAIQLSREPNAGPMFFYPKPK
jgi:hypothetical protein